MAPKVDYGKRNVAELRKMMRKRKMSHKGLKRDGLIEALRKHDNQDVENDGENSPNDAILNNNDVLAQSEAGRGTGNDNTPATVNTKNNNLDLQGDVVSRNETSNTENMFNTVEDKQTELRETAITLELEKNKTVAEDKTLQDTNQEPETISAFDRETDEGKALIKVNTFELAKVLRNEQLPLPNEQSGVDTSALIQTSEHDARGKQSDGDFQLSEHSKGPTSDSSNTDKNFKSDGDVGSEPGKFNNDKEHSDSSEDRSAIEAQSSLKRRNINDNEDSFPNGEIQHEDKKAKPSDAVEATLTQKTKRLPPVHYGLEKPAIDIAYWKTQGSEAFYTIPGGEEDQGKRKEGTSSKGYVSIFGPVKKK